MKVLPFSSRSAEVAVRRPRSFNRPCTRRVTEYTRRHKSKLWERKNDSVKVTRPDANTHTDETVAVT